MKTLLFFLVVLTVVGLNAINFIPLTNTELSVLLDLESIELYEFEIVEITTVKEREGRVDNWKGVRFSEILRKWTHLRNWEYEFLASDNYLIRLNIEEIARFNPIIAIERNSTALPKGQWRLVSPNMPEMYWVSHITEIREKAELVFQEPERIYPFHSVLNQTRLYINPLPFENVRGHRLTDILSILNNKQNGYIRIVTIDGIEQTLPLESYLKNAIMTVENSDENVSTYSIQCPDIPSGMWLRNIMLLQVNEGIVFFFSNVDKVANRQYRNFIEFVSKKNRVAHTDSGTYEVTNWESLNWQEILYIQ